jgi:hypothetical protein
MRTIDLGSDKAVQNAIWSADSRGLFISNSTEAGAELLYKDLNGSVRTLWTLRGSRPSLEVRVSKNGRQLAIHTVLRESNMWMIEDSEPLNYSCLKGPADCRSRNSRNREALPINPCFLRWVLGDLKNSLAGSTGPKQREARCSIKVRSSGRSVLIVSGHPAAGFISELI